MCTSKKVVKNFQVKVDLPKGDLKVLEENSTIDVLVTTSLRFHPCGDCPKIFLRDCIRVPISYKLGAFGFLEFAL